MIRDFGAYQIESCIAELEELRAAEDQLHAVPRTEKREAEGRIKAKRDALLRKVNNATAYLFLEAVQTSAPQAANSVALRTAWQQQRRQHSSETKLQEWQLKTIFESGWKSPPVPDLNTLPPGCFFISFTFTLEEPYISRDDNVYHIIENPVRRDKVYRVPFVAPSSWKGNLIAALHHTGRLRGDADVIRLFGNEKQEDEESEDFQRGCLHFYPTFFYETGLKIINPQDRRKRAGTEPIVFEIVRAGCSAEYALLYVPFHRVGAVESEESTEALKVEVARDLKLVVLGLQAMFREHGFSAKRTSGLGVAQELLSKGEILVRFEQIEPAPSAEKESSASELPRYLETPDRLKAEYLNADGTFSLRTEEYYIRPGKKGKKELDRAGWQLYQKAKNWWERRQKELAEATESIDAEALRTIEMPRQWIRANFGSFLELGSVVEHIAASLRGGQR